MKHVLIAVIIIAEVFCSYHLNAQSCGTVSVCSAGPNTQVGFPGSDSIPCAIQGVAYDYSVPFKMYSNFNYLGNHGVDSLTFDTIFNLPCGLCYSFNKASKTYAANEIGCLHISGTTNDPVGQYNLRMETLLYLTGLNGTPTGPEPPNVLDAAGIKIWLRVNAPGGSSCMAVDTSQNATNMVATSCNSSSNLTVSLGSNQTVCNGSVVTLAAAITGGQPPYSYNWSTSGSNLSCFSCSSPSVTVTQSSVIAVTVTDANNSTGTANITYTSGSTSLTFSLPAYINNNAPSFTLNGSPAGGTYTGVSGISGNTFNPSQAGLGRKTINYAYANGNCTGTVNSSSVIYDTIGTHCTDTAYVHINDTSYTHLSVTDTLLVNVNLTGINPPNNNNTIEVYPNPAHDHLIINNGNLGAMTGYSIKITNALGQVVFNQVVSQQQFYIDLHTFTGNGVYILYVLDAQQAVKSVKEIVLQ